MVIARRTFIQANAAFVLSFAGRSWAADRPSVPDLAGDIDILRDVLALHPGLLRYNNANQISSALGTLRSEFARSVELRERYLLLSRFLSEIRCGHTYCNFFNQNKDVATDLFDRPTRLPFEFKWIDRAMVVTRDFSGQLATGTKVVKLNGEPTEHLQSRMLPYVRADGHNDGKRISLLEVRGTDKIETFDVFQGLLAPPRALLHIVSAIDPSGATRTLDLPTMTLAERTSHMVSKASGQQVGALWTWQVHPDGFAVLTMPTWAVYDSKWNWKSWLSDRLDSLSGAKGLIIDLRSNEGGLDCGDPILARLIDRPFAPDPQEQRIRFQRTPPALDRYLDTWDNSFRTLGVGARSLAGGFYLRPSSETSLPLEPATKRLRIPVILLTSPANSSATFQFAQNLRRTGAGRLVGKTTGGNLRGINGGCFFFVRLPASGIEFDLPLVGYFPATPQPDAGLRPDVPIEESATDIANGRDLALESAIKLLSRSRA